MLHDQNGTMGGLKLLEQLAFDQDFWKEVS
jgi:hypothetical protein